MGFIKKAKTANAKSETYENKAFQYAEKEQQRVRANGFLVLANTVYFVYVLLMIFVSVVRGERSSGFFGFIGIIVLLSTILVWVVFKRNKKSKRLKYIMLIGLCPVSWVVSFAYSQDFAVIIGAFVLVQRILIN